VDSASELVKLYADKFDLLRPGGAAPKKPAGSGPSAATIKALEELKSVINGHLQVCVGGGWCVSRVKGVKGDAVCVDMGGSTGECQGCLMRVGGGHQGP
jgi:hypothetical protein